LAVFSFSGISLGEIGVLKIKLLLVCWLSIVHWFINWWKFAIDRHIALWFLQPGPSDFPHQCLIKRNKKTSTFYLYLALTPCEYLFYSCFIELQPLKWLLLQVFRGCFTFTGLTCKSLKPKSRGGTFLC
jgi:hypothetical protein